MNRRFTNRPLIRPLRKAGPSKGWSGLNECTVLKLGGQSGSRESS